jgi:hypothetical protein
MIPINQEQFMRKFTAAAITSTIATAAFALSVTFVSTPAHAKDGIVVGKMIYTADKHQLGAVYSVKKDGSAEVIVDTRLVIVPAASVESKDGKLWTSLTRKEALANR